MNKIFKRMGLVAAFAVSALFGAQSALAALSLTDGDKITLGYGGIAQGDPYGGGPFLATGVTVANGSAGSFVTFCLEYNEHFSPGSQYFVDINTGAVNGGVSTAGTYVGDVNGTTVPGFDPVSNATAWLYTAYRTNQSLLWAGAETSALDLSLQLAIWKLEGELSASASAGALTAYNGDSIAQGFVTSAIGAATGGFTNSYVQVMNLYTGYSNGVFSGASQDQLYLAPVPEPETYAMMLAGLGLMGFVARRRSRRNSA